MAQKVSRFWRRVGRCKHEWYPNYLEYVPCSTPMCGGSESYCMKCGVYVTKCGCGCENGMSGWPYRRFRRAEIKRRLRLAEKARRDDGEAKA